MFKNLSTSLKLYLSPALFIIVVIIGAITYINLMKTANNRSYVAFEAQNGLTIVANARVSAFSLFLEPSRKSLNTMNREFTKVKTYIKNLEEHQHHAKGLRLSKDAIKNIDRYLNVSNDYMIKKLALLRRRIKKNPPGFQRLSDKTTIYADKIVQDLKGVQTTANNLRLQALREIGETLGILVIISIIIFLLLSFSISRSIISSLNNFKDGLLSFFDFINKKSTDVRLLSDKNKDEFGQMAKLVNENIKSSQIGLKQDQALINETIKVLGEFELGDLSQRLQLDVENESLKKLKDVLNEMAQTLETNVENVLKILEEYSNNNFLNKADKEGLKGQLFNLADNVNILGSSTTSGLIDRKSSGLTLGESSARLLKHVNNLNNSSNEAAASLEETAAALEQITGNTRNNTANIDKMVDLSTHVTTSVKDGEKLASDTSKAMEDINSQVNAINEAISVIDQIAFQTNILSLNAAVEAATAGEAGKGFAVVAGEVRNLASRSAEAAKEIKGIVENATKKADEGKNIAADMISGYVELNGNVSQTIELISDIKMASKEQLLGIEQINDAVNQLDRQTQQNAIIASQTNDISLVVDNIAKESLSAVDAILFEGKDTVKAQKIKTQVMQNSSQNDILSRLQNKSQESKTEVNQTQTADNIKKDTENSKTQEYDTEELSSADTAVIRAKADAELSSIKTSSPSSDDEWETF